MDGLSSVHGDTDSAHSRTKCVRRLLDDAPNSENRINRKKETYSIDELHNICRFWKKARIALRVDKS